MDIIEHEVCSETVVESLHMLAEQIETASDLDASVVCVIRVDGNVRLYIIGDNLDKAIAEAGSCIDGAVRSLMLKNRMTH